MKQPLNILVSVHDHYNYLDSTICQGLQNLGHNVLGISVTGANYVTKRYNGEERSLFIQFIRDGGPLVAAFSVMCWGEDDQRGLSDVFNRGFHRVFVRDLLPGEPGLPSVYPPGVLATSFIPGEPGLPMNFAIEDRYYCITDKGYKSLKDREIDICFLGSLWSHRAEYIERLKKDFGQQYRLELGPRKFNEPDDKWSKTTLPYCAHDPKYFETLTNSKICLSFKGAGPDCARHYEIMASGAVCLIENMHTQMVADADVYWFDNYSDLAETVELVLQGIKDDPEAAQEAADYAWKENRSLHSTTARAAYLLDKCGC